MKNKKYIIAACGVLFALVVVFTTASFWKGNNASQIIGCKGCNVVVILVDTLRADHLPTYGYEKDTAPFLKSVFDKSTVFEKAFSASSWTAPATASVFTAQLPSTHGVITGFLATKRMIKDGSSIKMNRIADTSETLGEFMLRAGYQTAAVTDNLNIGTEIGFDRGFQHFRKLKEKGSAKVNQIAVEFLDKMKDNGPYFLYLHYIDPHAPYERHEPWFQDCVKKEGEDFKKQTVCAYDSEIRYLDSQIEFLYKKYSWDKNTVLVFLSDHGEEFWEHGVRGHGRTLYPEVTHVPLVIFHPEWEARRVSANVHTMDIMPTLAAMMGNEMKKDWEGDNLYKRLQKHEFPSDRDIFMERLRTPESKNKWWTRSVINKEWQLVQITDPNKGVKDELYNLEKDFYAQNNLFTPNNEQAHDLISRLSTLKPAEEVQGTPITIQPDREMVEQLRSLGYLK